MFEAPKPGVIPLRPLGVGEIVSGVFGTLRRYAKPIYLPLAVITGSVLVLLGACIGVGYATAAPLPEHGDEMTTSQAVGLVGSVSVGSALMVFWAVAAFTVATAVCSVVLRHAVLGRPLTARQAWAQARPYLARVFGTQVLIGLACGGLVLVAIVPGLLIGLLTTAEVGVVLGVLLVIPALIGALYVQVRLVPTLPLLVLEEQRPVAAIRRAWRLNHGNWWRSLGIPYLINMIGSIVGQVIMTPITLIGLAPTYLDAVRAAQADPYAPPPTPTGAAVVTMLALIVLGAVLVSTLTLPLAPLANGLLYVDRRIRLENLAATLIATAYPQPEPAPPADAPPTEE